MFRPASRQISTSRVASATSVCSPGLEELAAAAERAGAQAQHRHLEARAAELSVFHLHTCLRRGALALIPDTANPTARIKNTQAGARSMYCSRRLLCGASGISARSTSSIWKQLSVRHEFQLFELPIDGVAHIGQPPEVILQETGFNLRG